jgi:hypothetical protein
VSDELKQYQFGGTGLPAADPEDGNHTSIWVWVADGYIQYDGDDMLHKVGLWKWKDITHWMPLPEPPEADNG